MSPRPFRESPDRQAQRIRKHVAQAREYWDKGKAHLSERDICQAAEKGWGTVAQLTKAVATMRGWNHYDHVAIQECMYQLLLRKILGQAEGPIPRNAGRGAACTDSSTRSI